MVKSFTTAQQRSVIDGWIILLVFLPMMIVFTALLHFKHRRSPLMVKRSYFFVLLQHVGAILLQVLFCVRQLLAPTVYCRIAVFTTFASFPLYGLPFLVRCWTYMIRYYLTQERNKSGTSTFLLKRVWLLSPRFLLLLWAVPFAVQMAIPIGLSIVSHIHHKAPTASGPQDYCGLPEPMLNLFFKYVLGFVILYLIVVILVVVFLWKSRDAYYIKSELRFHAFVVVPGFIFLLISSLRIHGFLIGSFINFEFVVGLAIFISFLYSGVYMYVLCQRQSRASEELDDDKKDLVERLLTSGSFRQKFSDFLCLQLCVENLLFWEAARQFRLYSAGADQEKQAIALYNKYIKPGSEYEINIPSETVSILQLRISCAIDSSIFEKAENDVLALMKFHSYPLYLQTRSNPNTDTASGNEASGASSSEMVVGVATNEIWLATQV